MLRKNLQILYCIYSCDETRATSIVFHCQLCVFVILLAQITQKLSHTSCGYIKDYTGTKEKKFST